MKIIYWFKSFIPKNILGRRKDIFKPKRNIPVSKILLNIDSSIPKPNELNEIAAIAMQQLYYVVQTVSQFLGGLPHPKLLLSGSSAERFNAPISKYWIDQADTKVEDSNHALLSDYDFMIFNQNSFASFNTGYEYIIETNERDITPGYARIISSHTMSILSAKCIKKKIYKAMMNLDVSRLPGFKGYTGGYWCCYFTGSKNQNFDVLTQGPAVRIMIENVSEKRFFLVDLTYCLQCKEWPHLSDWPSRQDRLWPNKSDVDRIVNQGCHLVPKSQPNDKKFFTWRFSFSKAEVELSKLVNSTARKCFISLKIIGKDYLLPRCKRLKSYHLKTIFLNMLENTPPAYWCDEKIEECFHLLLDHVIQAVETRICPHYWLYGINLFDTLTENDVNTLLSVLIKVKESPSNYIESLFFKTDDLGEEVEENSCEEYEYNESVQCLRKQKLRNYGTYVYWS